MNPTVADPKNNQQGIYAIVWPSLLEIAGVAVAYAMFLTGSKREPVWQVGILVAAFTVLWLMHSSTILRRRTYPLWRIVLFVCVTLADILVYLLGYAAIFDVTGIVSTTSTAVPNRYDCLYFSAVTWTTVGYGDFIPASGRTRFFAMVEAFNSYLFLGVFIAILIQMLSRLHDKASNATATLPP